MSLRSNKPVEPRKRTVKPPPLPVPPPRQQTFATFGETFPSHDDFAEFFKPKVPGYKSIFDNDEAKELEAGFNKLFITEETGLDALAKTSQDSSVFLHSGLFALAIKQEQENAFAGLVSDMKLMNVKDKKDKPILLSEGGFQVKMSSAESGASQVPTLSGKLSQMPAAERSRESVKISVVVEGPMKDELLPDQVYRLDLENRPLEPAPPIIPLTEKTAFSAPGLGSSVPTLEQILITGPPPPPGTVVKRDEMPELTPVVPIVDAPSSVPPPPSVPSGPPPPPPPGMGVLPPPPPPPGPGGPKKASKEPTASDLLKQFARRKNALEREKTAKKEMLAAAKPKTPGQQLASAGVIPAEESRAKAAVKNMQKLNGTQLVYRTINDQAVRWNSLDLSNDLDNVLDFFDKIEELAREFALEDKNVEDQMIMVDIPCEANDPRIWPKEIGALFAFIQQNVLDVYRQIADRVEQRILPRLLRVKTAEEYNAIIFSSTDDCVEKMLLELDKTLDTLKSLRVETESRNLPVAIPDTNAYRKYLGTTLTEKERENGLKEPAWLKLIDLGIPFYTPLINTVIPAPKFVNFQFAEKFAEKFKVPVKWLDAHMLQPAREKASGLKMMIIKSATAACKRIFQESVDGLNELRYGDLSEDDLIDAYELDRQINIIYPQIGETLASGRISKNSLLTDQTKKEFKTQYEEAFTSNIIGEINVIFEDEIIASVAKGLRLKSERQRKKPLVRKPVSSQLGKTNEEIKSWLAIASCISCGNRIGLKYPTCFCEPRLIGTNDVDDDEGGSMSLHRFRLTSHGRHSVNAQPVVCPGFSSAYLNTFVFPLLGFAQQKTNAFIFQMAELEALLPSTKLQILFLRITVNFNKTVRLEHEADFAMILNGLVVSNAGKYYQYTESDDPNALHGRSFCLPSSGTHFYQLPSGEVQMTGPRAALEVSVDEPVVIQLRLPVDLHPERYTKELTASLEIVVGLK